jgi:hypothetical protein
MSFQARKEHKQRGISDMKRFLFVLTVISFFIFAEGAYAATGIDEVEYSTTNRVENIPNFYNSDSIVRLKVDLNYQDIIEMLPELFDSINLSGREDVGVGHVEYTVDVKKIVFTPNQEERDTANISIPFNGEYSKHILLVKLHDRFNGNAKIAIRSEITPDWEVSLRLSNQGTKVYGVESFTERVISFLKNIFDFDTYGKIENVINSAVRKFNDNTHFSLRESLRKGWERSQKPILISIKDYPDMFLNITPDFLAVDPLQFFQEKVRLNLALKACLELSARPRDYGSIKELPEARSVPKEIVYDIILNVPVIVPYKELNELIAAQLDRIIHHEAEEDDQSFILLIPEVYLSGREDGTLVLNCSLKVEFPKLGITYEMGSLSVPVRLAYDEKNQSLSLGLYLSYKDVKYFGNLLKGLGYEKVAETVNYLIFQCINDKKIPYSIAPLIDKLNQRIDNEVHKYADGLLILDDTYAVAPGIEGLTINDEEIRLKSFFRGRGISVDAMGFLMLIIAKTNPQFQDAKGRTLLSRAILENRMVLVGEILKCGVDPSVVDFQGKNAIDFAKESNRGDIVELIENAFKNQSQSDGGSSN